MGLTEQRTSSWFSWAVLLPALGAATQCAASDPEREQLAVVVRQIDLVSHLAVQATQMAPQERARYYFDYGRLHTDLQRVRAGLQDYLTPPRAQPREPPELSGQYRQEATAAEQATTSTPPASPAIKQTAKARSRP